MSLALAPALAGALAILLHGRIPEDPAYLRFADQRTAFGIPHFGDVMTNAAFLAVGLLGLLFLATAGRTGTDGSFWDARERAAYFVLFAGVLLTSFGSAYYHLAPDTARLFWDRLPMTFVFLSFVSIVISERVSLRIGVRALFPLLVVGVGSVFYWIWTESAGRGDLRPYAVVQYSPALIIPLLLLLFPPRYSHSGCFWGALGCYVAAKVCELLDARIFRLTGIVSGHSLKHVVSGAATGLILWMLWRRRPIEKEKNPKEAS